MFYKNNPENSCLGEGDWQDNSHIAILGGAWPVYLQSCPLYWSCRAVSSGPATSSWCKCRVSFQSKASGSNFCKSSEMDSSVPRHKAKQQLWKSV